MADLVDMDSASPVALWVGVWGAVLSTTLAAIQLANWKANRPRLKVACRWEAGTVEDPAGADIGTPVKVQRGRDILDEVHFLRMEVSNSGDKGIQISSVTLESFENGIIGVAEIVPSVLPTVLEPRAAITLTVQKGFIDCVSRVTFFGVSDALGVRHAASEESIRSVVRTSWEMPTAVQWFARRDDPAIVISAFQAKQRSRLSSRELQKREKKPHVIIMREPPKPPKPQAVEPQD